MSFKRIICIGDWGYDTMDKGIIQKLRQENYDEIFLMGDNFYFNGVEDENDEQWNNKLKKYFPPHIKKCVVLGNHDYLGNVHCQLLYTFNKSYFSWFLPHFYYDIVDKQRSCHFFFIDTQLLALEHTMNLSNACNISQERLQDYLKLYDIFHEAHKQWLQNSLKHSSAKWKFVIGHYPVLSGGPHEMVTELSSYLLPLFRKYKVDFYLSGHDHNTQVLKKNNTLFIISGGTSFTVAPEKRKETIFSTDKKGYIQLNTSLQEVNVEFVQPKKNNLLIHSLFKK